MSDEREQGPGGPGAAGDPAEPRAELRGPIGWLMGLVNSFLMLGVAIGAALVRGILAAFNPAPRDPPEGDP